MEDTCFWYNVFEGLFLEAPCTMQVCKDLFRFLQKPCTNEIFDVDSKDSIKELQSFLHCWIQFWASDVLRVNPSSDQFKILSFWCTGSYHLLNKLCTKEDDRFLQNRHGPQGCRMWTHQGHILHHMKPLGECQCVKGALEWNNRFLPCVRDFEGWFCYKPTSSGTPSQQNLDLPENSKNSWIL